MPGLPVRRSPKSCGGGGEAAEGWGRDPGLPAGSCFSAPHHPPLDAEAAAAALPRPPCAQAGPVRGGVDAGNPLQNQTKPIPLPSSSL